MATVVAEEGAEGAEVAAPAIEHAAEDATENAAKKSAKSSEGEAENEGESVKSTESKKENEHATTNGKENEEDRHQSQDYSANSGSDSGSGSGSGSFWFGSGSLQSFSALTPTAQQEIVDQVSANLVDKICYAMVGPNSDLSTALITSVTNIISEIFDKTDLNAKDRMSDTILGGIQNAFRPITGSSLLLYSILKTDRGMQLYRDLLSTLFARAKNETKDLSGYVQNFVRNVIAQLNTQPKELFLSPSVQHGGNIRNHTVKKYSKKWTTTRNKRSVQKGGLRLNPFETTEQTAARERYEQKQQEDLTQQQDDIKQNVTDKQTEVNSADDTLNALKNGNSELMQFNNPSELHKKVFSHQKYGKLSNSELDAQIKYPENEEEKQKLQDHKNDREQLAAQETAKKNAAQSYIDANRIGDSARGKTYNTMIRARNMLSRSAPSQETAIAQVRAKQRVSEVKKEIGEHQTQRAKEVQDIRNQHRLGNISTEDRNKQLAESKESANIEYHKLTADRHDAVCMSNLSGNKRRCNLAKKHRSIAEQLGAEKDLKQSRSQLEEAMKTGDTGKIHEAKQKVIDHENNVQEKTDAANSHRWIKKKSSTLKKGSSRTGNFTKNARSLFDKERSRRSHSQGQTGQELSQIGQDQMGQGQMGQSQGMTSPQAQAIVNDFGTDLLKSVSVRLGSMENMILRKILDAVYYQLQHHPKPILESIVSVMTNPTVTNGLNGASTKILLCSCLFNDAVLFGSIITDTYNSTKTKEIQQNPAEYITSRAFTDKFTEKFIEKLSEKVFP